MQYNIHIEGLEELKRNFKQAPANIKKKISHGVSQAGGKVQKIMMKESPYDTGKLSTTIALMIRPTSADIYPTQRYAQWVEEGRGVVEPVRRRALKIKTGQGQYILRKRARASKKNPFVKRTYELTKPVVEKHFELLLDEVVKDLAK